MTKQSYLILIQSNCEGKLHGKLFSSSWLLDCPYQDVNLEDYVIVPDNRVYIQDIRYEKNLFDYNQEKFIRQVNISQLDETTDTQQDWKYFLNNASKVDKLILCEDRKKSKNKIYSGYLQATRKAYIWHLKQASITCQIYY